MIVSLKCMEDRDFTFKWVMPFYQKIGHFYAVEDEISEAYYSVANDLNPKIVETLFSQRNWRHRSTAAWFSSIRHWTDFEEQIVEYLLRCELCYEGENFLLSLASFGTPNAIEGITTYLDKYLIECDPYGSQAGAMHALKWLDLKKGTSLFTKYEPKWINFCGNSDRFLDESCFFRHAEIIERLRVNNKE